MANAITHTPLQIEAGDIQVVLLMIRVPSHAYRVFPVWVGLRPFEVKKHIHTLMVLTEIG